MTKILIIDTHPVQYRAPIYAQMAQAQDISLVVAYYNDASVRGYLDVEFQKEIKWNTPLLSGYAYEVLLPGRTDTRDGFFGFKGIHVLALLRRHAPDLVIVHSVNHLVGIRFALVAKLLGIRCWLRVETQDEAFVRGSGMKQKLRKLIYRGIYGLFDGAFCFGKLNRKHLLAHGFRPEQMVATHFSTVDKYKGLSNNDKQARRDAVRHRLAIPADSLVVGVFGKLIAKKDPETVMKACLRLADRLGRDITCILVGSGALEADLVQRYGDAASVRFVFAGFVNQEEIGDYYLAADTVVLASRREGEVWGLVCNEALQAGCALVMSDAVGAAAEFGGLERCGIFPSGDEAALVELLVSLAAFPRDFDWCLDFMEDYSTEAAARNMLSVVRQGQIPGQRVETQ